MDDILQTEAALWHGLVGATGREGISDKQLMYPGGTQVDISAIVDK